jgi:type III restriction enzyme
LRRPVPIRRQPSPAEQGELFRVPLLTYRTGELWEDFEETHLLQGEWKLVDFPSLLTEAEFPPDERAAQRGVLTLSEIGRLKLEYFERIEAQMSLFDFKADWSLEALVSWLERNTPDFNTTADDKAAFLLHAVKELIEARHFSLDELVYRKFRLRAALDEKMRDALHTAKRSTYQRLMDFGGDFRVSDDVAVIFQQGRYAYNFPYVGFTQLPKHFFSTIGDLKAEGEEFDCALFIATQLEGVKYWVRNVERKTGAFSLQTATDRFYPDFVVQLDEKHANRVLAIEYKNARDWRNDDSREKRSLGDLWERRSDGRCLFIMPEGRELETIRQKIQQ